jgi:predicted DNA-binding transcriptional regulator AlpA
MTLSQPGRLSSSRPALRLRPCFLQKKVAENGSIDLDPTGAIGHNPPPSLAVHREETCHMPNAPTPPTHPSDDRLVRSREAVALLGISERTLYRWLRGKAIPSQKKLQGRWTFRLADLKKFLDEGR